MDNVLEYISKQELLQREILNRIRELIKGLVPLAEEKMSYGAPAFRLNGKTLVYAAFKNHIGFYPEPEIIEKFKKDLANYQTAKGTVKFSLDKPIPYDLIEKMVRYKFETN